MTTFPSIKQSQTPLLPYAFSVPSKEALVKQYVGKTLDQVRTPSLVINRSIVKKNCERLKEIANQQKIKLRIHVKTHKTIEGTEIQLETANTDSIVVSTLPEAYYMIQSPLVSTGKLKDVLLGFPITPDKFDDVFDLSKQVESFSIFIDDLQTLDALDKYYNEKYGSNSDVHINAFLKVDCGYHRAGVAINNQDALNLAKRLANSTYIHIQGLYAHAGHSYSSRNESSALEYLQGEIKAAKDYQQFFKDNGVDIPYCSIGATPTAMAAEHLKKNQSTSESSSFQLGESINELHCGVFAFNDRQQVATSLSSNSDVAVSVIARIASKYPERNSLLLDAGALALSKDTSPQGGFGDIVGHDHWQFSKISQEHGIITDVPLEDFNTIPVGKIIHIRPNHCCLTTACHAFYLIIENGNDKIVDVWVPVKGW